MIRGIIVACFIFDTLLFMIVTDFSHHLALQDDLNSMFFFQY